MAQTLIMILKMSAIVTLHVLMTFVIYKRLKNKTLTLKDKIIIGLVYGFCAVLSNHFSVNYGHSLLNIRDLSPLTAGLFFDPIAGIIAGLIGGIERYIVGTWFGVGEYTRIACSVSTCLAGIFSAFLTVFIFKRKKPSVQYSFFMGAVMEVFHMYMVFLTHRKDIMTALAIVRINSVPMIVFTAIGLAATSAVLLIYDKEWINPLKKISAREVSIEKKFRFWLFVVAVGALLTNHLISINIQTRKSYETAIVTCRIAAEDIHAELRDIKETGSKDHTIARSIGTNGTFDIISDGESSSVGNNKGEKMPQSIIEKLSQTEDECYFNADFFGEKSLCYLKKINTDTYILITLPYSEIYYDRVLLGYETMFSNIVVLSFIYVLISVLVQSIIINKLENVNDSLNRITEGNLDEKLSVYDSAEFAQLSDNTNQMVDTLKDYINAAEKRMEEDLFLAKSIQESALPHEFNFHRSDFELYAAMNPAKQVGGDFYDFFFIDHNRLALVIADVSGKSIPASLFMMRSKTAVKSVTERGGSPADILSLTNNILCAENEINMFVTVWLGIIDLNTGIMKCANAGHEYPMIRKNGKYSMFKDPHSPALGLLKNLKFKEYELQFKPGDSIFVYTDGVPEAINEKEEAYGTDRFINTLDQCSNDNLVEAVGYVMDDVKEFAGDAEQFDDITILGFRYNATGNASDSEESIK